MGWTAVDWIITGAVVPVVGTFLWAIKCVLGYLFKQGGFFDRVSDDLHEWFRAQRAYMDASREIQATTAFRLEQHANQLDLHTRDMMEHGATLAQRTGKACECLDAIQTTQEEHTAHFETLIDAGVKACNVALTVCTELAIAPEHTASIEKIKAILEVREK